MGASVDDRKEERVIDNIMTAFHGMPIRESSLMPPNTMAFVDSKTQKLVAICTNVGVEDWSRCYEWFTPIRGID